MVQFTFILRQHTTEDISFIYNSFLKSLHNSFPIKFVPDTLYYGPQSQIIESLLKTANVMVACYPEDPSEILGYVIYQEIDSALILHYIYVKQPYRMNHVASDIISKVI